MKKNPNRYDPEKEWAKESLTDWTTTTPTQAIIFFIVIAVVVLIMSNLGESIWGILFFLVLVSLKLAAPKEFD